MTKLIPVREFEWPEIGPIFTLTCVDHPTAVYHTKNPWTRNLHVIKYPDGMRSECPCPFSKLAVVEDADA